MSVSWVKQGGALAAAALLSAAGFACAPPEVPDGRTLLVRGADAPAEITRVLAAHGHYLEELTPVTADLETAFLELTGEGA